jgi:hypothetical protein
MRSATLASLAAFAAAAVAIVLAVIAIADSDGGGGDKDVSAQLTQLMEDHEGFHDALTTVQLVSALDALDGAGIHEFDEETTQAATIDNVPAGYSAAVEKVHTVVSSFEWPEDTHEALQEITTQSETLSAALDGDDLAAIKAASPQYHAAWHELREVGYSALGAEVPGHGDDTESMDHSE